MLLIDIFSIVCENLDNYKIENINALKNLSYVSKDLNVLIYKTTQYVTLKTHAGYSSPIEALFSYISDIIDMIMYQNKEYCEMTQLEKCKQIYDVVEHLIEEDYDEINTQLSMIFLELMYNEIFMYNLLNTKAVNNTKYRLNITASFLREVLFSKNIEIRLLPPSPLSLHPPDEDIESTFLEWIYSIEL